jgi:glucose-1-phosphate cytidylyltransferase
MKVVILAGGVGSRISEESVHKPKPMIEIGEMPILWHLMKIYSHYGFNEFIICAGYKQHMIKQWFSDYYLYASDVTFDFSAPDSLVVHHRRTEPWKVTVIDTGMETQTGGRLKRVQKYVGDETFMLNYGDAVGNIDIAGLLAYHCSHGKVATVSVYNYGQTKGVLEIDQTTNLVTDFREKSDFDGNLINIGFYVLEKEVFAHIRGDSDEFERHTLSELVGEQQVQAYVHRGFWQCMDTLREKNKLEALWKSGSAPWKVWEDR